jgi:flagellar hook protein FlgE
MIASLYAGISGLSANATAMTVIGDNIANVNTTAFKSNCSHFANVLSASLGGDSATNSVGRGVEFWGADAQWTQGSLESTSNATDLAINGKGFFVVKNPDSGSNFYTRAGNFTFDKYGYLVNPDGLRLQGYELDSNGNIGNIEDVYIPGERTSPPQATTEFNFDLNLDASADAGSTFSTSQSVYDSLGNAIPLTLIFTKSSTAGTWAVTANVPSSAGSAVSFDTGSGSNSTFDLVFGTDGTMSSPSGNVDVALTLSNGANSPLTFSWALYDESGNSYGDLTGYSSDSATTFQYQDGYPAGTLRGISVNEEGVVTATYSNGEMIPMFEVTLADFPSYDGLSKMGKNLYSESMASGQPLMGTVGSGRLGSVSPTSLEMSNVDLAEEFVKMITTQRAFQANSRVITASDEILTELINIKR